MSDPPSTWPLGSNVTFLAYLALVSLAFSSCLNFLCWHQPAYVLLNLLGCRFCLLVCRIRPLGPSLVLEKWPGLTHSLLWSLIQRTLGRSVLNWPVLCGESLLSSPLWKHHFCLLSKMKWTLVFRSFWSFPTAAWEILSPRSPLNKCFCVKSWPCFATNPSCFSGMLAGTGSYKTH